MQATAIAQPNIALIKYWGKRDVVRNLPAVGSISITLSDLFTEVVVSLDDDLPGDVLSINGEPDVARLGRMSRCLDDVIGETRSAARIKTQSNFPIAAGLASSASAFAAATLAAAAATGKTLSTEALARLAGRSSGSAARSLYGGFTELANVGDEISLSPLCDERDWPLQVVVAITATAAKPVGSTQAMETSKESSPFYDAWVARQDADLSVARDAIESRDFEKLAKIAEHNCLKMHSVMWASRPPNMYWNAGTLRCLEAIRELQQQGHGVFFTIDAGPQVKAVCLPGDAAAVQDALSSLPGVEKTMRCGLGAAAHLVDD